MATVAIPAGRRPLFGRCLVACVSAWLTAVPVLAIVLVGVRALSERWFGDVDTSSSLGFFSSSAGDPLGLYGLTTVALAVAVTLRAWLRLQCGARVAWWASLTVGALGAAGTQLGQGRGALPLVALAAAVATAGARARRQLPALPRSVLCFAAALWLLLGAVLFVAAGRAVANDPLRVVFDGSGTAEAIGLPQSETPPLSLTLRNASASRVVVRAVRLDVAGAGPRQTLTAGALPAGGYPLPPPLARSFAIAPRSDVAIGARWRSVCQAGAPGLHRLRVTLRVLLRTGAWRAERAIDYTCVG